MENHGIHPVGQVRHFFRRVADNLALIPAAVRAIRLGGRAFHPLGAFGRPGAAVNHHHHAEPNPDGQG